VALKACTVVIQDIERDCARDRRDGRVPVRSYRPHALATLRGHGWVGQIGKGLTNVTVKVRHPDVTHVVKIQDFENWLNRGSRSPAEILLKTRLRQMLGTGKQ
jgi:hypothetical protein